MKEEFGLRIKKIRENMNMTKENFAKLIGISGQYLGLVEHGKNYLSIEKIKTLCDITNLSADYILFGKEDNCINECNKILSEFNATQIEAGCEALKKLAIMIKEK